jgi:hypothetical protein
MRINAIHIRKHVKVQSKEVKRESAKGNIKLKTSYKDLPERIIAESD